MAASELGLTCKVSKRRVLVRNTYKALKRSFAASGDVLGGADFAPGANAPKPMKFNVLLMFHPSGRSSCTATYLSRMVVHEFPMDRTILFIVPSFTKSSRRSR